MGLYNITISYYADDAVLIADSEDDLQRHLHAWNIIAKRCKRELDKYNTTNYDIQLGLEVTGSRKLIIIK